MAERDKTKGETGEGLPAAVIDCALYEDGERIPGRVGLEKILDRIEPDSGRFAWIGLYEGVGRYGHWRSGVTEDRDPIRVTEGNGTSRHRARPRLGLMPRAGRARTRPAELVESGGRYRARRGRPGVSRIEVEHGVGAGQVQDPHGLVPDAGQDQAATVVDQPAVAVAAGDSGRRSP
jgi:hypothetical protein